LKERAVDFDVFAPGRDEIVEYVMDGAGNQTTVILVLFN
jgi:hypothetical protein